MKDKHKIVKIEWIDAQTQTSRLSLDEVKHIKSAVTLTVGYLVNEDKDSVAVCSWIHVFDGGDLYCDTHIIPKAIIKSMRVVK